MNLPIPIVNGEKECTKCGVVQPLTSFYKSKRHHRGRKSWCAECERKRGSEYWRNLDPKIAKKRQLKTKLKHLYGITVEEYDELIAEGCGICGSHEKLHIDHDHSNGKVRAALCHYCNVGLGVFKDDPERLKKAIDYLEEHQEKGEQ